MDLITTNLLHSLKTDDLCVIKESAELINYLLYKADSVNTCALMKHCNILHTVGYLLNWSQQRNQHVENPSFVVTLMQCVANLLDSLWHLMSTDQVTTASKAILDLYDGSFSFMLRYADSILEN
jgi:hypothetical protein